MKKVTSKPKFYAIIGLGGVHQSENATAKKWDGYFEWPMILLAVWILFLWHFERVGYAQTDFARGTDIGIWLFFMLEFVALTSLVDQKWLYIRNNWMNLAIILMGLPILWGDFSYAALLRGARLFVMFTLLVSVFDSIKEVLSKNHLGMTLIICAFCILVAGVLVAGFDPAIENPLMGIWWAWVTVTTVGYGDVVPASLAGKLIASVLILIGVAMLSLLTASFSAFFISRQDDVLNAKEDEQLEELAKISNILDNIDQRLKNIERIEGLSKADKESTDKKSL